MRFTVCESTTPPIKSLLQQHFILWYSDVDTTAEYYPYAYGLGQYILPLIAVISMDDSANYLERTTAYQYPADFYNRLQLHVGDINHSVSITLEDAILALQVVSNESPANIHNDGDINGDQQLGIAEAIYLLKILAAQ